MKVELVVADTSKHPTEKLDNAPSELIVGTWFWVIDGKDKNLGCLTHVGSNYAEMTYVNGSSDRVHFNELDARCEPTDPTSYIAGKLALHQGRVRGLLDDIKQLTARLGVGHHEELVESSGATALAVAHGTADIQAHKKALILAKEKTLPDLFEAVKKEHEVVAMWMKAEMIPMKAHFAGFKSTITRVEDRIFTVELYAGLTEQLVQIREGQPAPNDTKVSLFQRRHYMDEECLVNYKAGGMDFQSIEAFDEWLLHDENRERILPLPRCIVAFRVRRNPKDYGRGLSAHIQFQLKASNEQTFLYLRNGEQVWRLSTSIDFGEQLFPDVEQSALLGGGDLWIRTWANQKFEQVLSQREYDNVLLRYQELRSEYVAELKEWRWGAKKEGRSGMRPWLCHEGTKHYLKQFEPCTPGHLFYDDAIAKVKQTATEHNRVAVVLQGLLDRSPALHPHPPWRLWTMEGFTMGVDLVYDDSRGLTDGPPPDFEAYRAELAKSIGRGSMTVGQEHLWLQHEAEKENERRGRRGGYRDELEAFRPYGNPGPGMVARVGRVTRGEQRMGSFTWMRDRQGYKRGAPEQLKTTFTCPLDGLFNVSAYVAGDYKRFYADPRTRAEYLKWAPILLAAEDYVGRGGDAKQGVDLEEAEEEVDE